MSCVGRREKDPLGLSQKGQEEREVVGEEREKERGEREEDMNKRVKRTRPKAAVKKVPSSLTFLSPTSRKTNSILKVGFVWFVFF